MKFKIHTEEVRQAAKKNNLKIVSNEYYGSILNNNNEIVTEYACAIGQLYTCKTGLVNSYKAEQWANKKFGLVYTKGFVNGFDGHKEEDILTMDYYKRLSKQSKKNMLNGFRNGVALHKSLIDNCKENHKENHKGN